MQPECEPTEGVAEGPEQYSIQQPSTREERVGGRVGTPGRSGPCYRVGGGGSAQGLGIGGGGCAFREGGLKWDFKGGKISHLRLE